MTTIRILSLFLIILSGEQLIAQNYAYSYNANGSRYSRVLSLKSTRDNVIEPVTEKLSNLKITLFPNPTKGEIVLIVTNLNPEESSRILIYDTSGRLLQTRDGLSESNTFNFSSLPNGMYIMKIFIGQQKTDWKIIKE